MGKSKYKSTLNSCYIGYIVQAVVNNFPSLLFVIFRKFFGVTISQLANLILVLFLTQLAVDVVSIKLIDKIGFRKSAVIAQIFSALGLIMLGILPNVMTHTYPALIISAVFYAIGAGFQETVLSPIADSIADEFQGGTLLFLHSFYSVGQILAVLVTTVAIKIFGEEYWYILPFVWAVIPIYNTFRFLKVPLHDTLKKEEKTPLKELLSSKSFILSVILMVGAGASELSMAQWSSMFAEKGLNVSKMTGDLLGPCLFAVFMFGGRILSGITEKKIDTKKMLLLCSVLCVICYLVTAFSLNGYLALAGCGICGFAIAIMWPGTLAVTSEKFPKGGAAMFSILALFGDVGCSVGPWVSGKISDISQRNDFVLQTAVKYGLTAEQAGLRCGMLISAVFPLMMIICLLLFKNKKEK